MSASASLRRDLTAAALLCIALAPLALAQIPDPADPLSLTRQAVARLSEAKTATHRFTNFDLSHNQNRDEKGRLYSDTTTLYEDTWIADLPFKRVVATDGRPLTDKELEKEQRRYDQAVHDRLALDDAARARFVHERFMEAGLDLEALTSPAFRLTRLRAETLNGHATTVIDAAPSTPTAAIHYTLWITTDNPTILRFTFEAISDTPKLLRGSHGQKDFLVLEGTPLPSHTTVHALVLVGHTTITVDTEHTYSKYRRFTTTTRMLPTPESTISEPRMMPIPISCI